MVEPQRWYVVYCKPRKEETARFHLSHKGLETFFPRLLLPKRTMNRQPIVPLFPSYLFVQLCTPEEYNYARWSPGVRCVVNFNGTPTPVDDEVVLFLKKRANPDGIVEACVNLAVGQEVRITGGPFAGLMGIIQNPPDARGRVRILLELLGRQVRAEVPVEFTNGGWRIVDRERPPLVS
ncbi:MAG: transcription termination/antitermination NusG family protein [Thermodesulfobacteriota bacterium]|jgi:transcriptional antiterminator RfaH